MLRHNYDIVRTRFQKQHIMLTIQDHFLQTNRKYHPITTIKKRWIDMKRCKGEWLIEKKKEVEEEIREEHRSKLGVLDQGTSTPHTPEMANTPPPQIEDTGSEGESTICFSPIPLTPITSANDYSCEIDTPDSTFTWEVSPNNTDNEAESEHIQDGSNTQDNDEKTADQSHIGQPQVMETQQPLTQTRIGNNIVGQLQQHMDELSRKFPRQ
ncbi:uncharacterized protein [Hyperolius riggenbachi]|uniref:uncharacterized protein n=1 Tax=Hyperolius riggenbachi TaxID=752182 RepID=UPI0035A2FE11